MLRETLKSLGRGWQGIADSLRSDKLDRLNLDLGGSDLDVVRKRVKEWADASGGEVSARQMAAQIGQLYLDLTPVGKHRFLQMLVNDLGTDKDVFRDLCRSYIDAADEETGAIEERLREAMIPQRLRLLRQFNVLPQGIKFLVDLRADLVKLMKDDPSLVPLNQELKHLLATWFDVGLLDMQRITWNSPASLLEKLIRYEAVHEINSWQDMQHRLHNDRRCYAFFHPNMPGEPLIFVEVALVNGISRSVQELLDDSAPDVKPEDADTAIFYSISNAQKGLQGISFGNFLIKRVVEELKAELPNIVVFSTLSPIPGLSRWLKSIAPESIVEYIGEEGAEAITSAIELLGAGDSLAEVLAEDTWLQNPEALALLQPSLELLLYSYFHTRRADNQPIDPVERFHLGNGARIQQLNWMGDVSDKGLSQSAGLMVNYLYPIQDIDKNHELYATKRKIVLSSEIRALGKEINGRKNKTKRVK